MSEPKRYQPVVQCVEPSYQAQMIEPKVMEFSEGEYVLHSDYARLKAEVERLTKAGDAMHCFLIGYIVENRLSSSYLNKLDDGWVNAREVQS